MDASGMILAKAFYQPWWTEFYDRHVEGLFIFRLSGDSWYLYGTRLGIRIWPHSESIVWNAKSEEYLSLEHRP